MNNIFINNTATEDYFKLIDSAKDRSSTIEYTERHHIIPKSLGGNDNPLNLVELTNEEHFKAHVLLTEMTIGEARAKMCYALWNMSNVKNVHQTSRYIPTPEEYNEAKIKRQQLTTSIETRSKIGKSRKNKIAVYHPTLKILKYISENELESMKEQGFVKGGVPKTEEHKKKISETNKRLGILPASIGWNKGLTKDTNDSLKKISEKRKGQTPYNKGKSNIDLFGEEKANKLKEKNKTKDAIPLIIDGIEYYSIIEASRQLKITERKAKQLGLKNAHK
jgi:hypothetical protein